MLDLLRRLVTCFEVHKDIGLPSDVSAEVLHWLKGLLHELFVVIPPATRSRFEEANDQRRQQSGHSHQRGVVGSRPRKRKTVATPSRGPAAAIKKPRLQGERGNDEAKNQVEDEPTTECQRNMWIATQEPIRENLGGAEGSEGLPNPLVLPSPRELLDLPAPREPTGSCESPPVVALDDTAPCEVMTPVAQDADALLCARNELGPMEGEVTGDLARQMSALDGRTAEEEGGALLREGRGDPGRSAGGGWRGTAGGCEERDLFQYRRSEPESGGIHPSLWCPSRSYDGRLAQRGTGAGWECDGRRRRGDLLREGQ